MRLSPKRSTKPQVDDFKATWECETAETHELDFHAGNYSVRDWVSWAIPDIVSENRVIKDNSQGYKADKYEPDTNEFTQHPKKCLTAPDCHESIAKLSR